MSQASNKNQANKPKVGDRVTCKIVTKGYSSHHAVLFTPGMVGRIEAEMPKVRICVGPGLDRCHTFFVVDFGWRGKLYKTSLNRSNCIKLPQQ